MTQEDKELLLKDLCARLPYGVIVDYKENEFEIPHWKIITIYPNTFDGWIGYDKRIGAGSESGSRPFKIGEIKPYLRPLSSMTEEEFLEYYNIKYNKVTYRYNYERFDVGKFHSVGIIPIEEYLDWLLKNHFDFRGLIPKGLALEAPKDMYKNETI